MVRRDSEHTRRRWHNRIVAFKAKWLNWLAIAGATIAVASAGVWLIREASYLVSSSGPAEGSLIVNINTSTQAELESIPGIGPALGAQIIAGRPYGSVDELVQIAGIGEATLDSVRPFVTVEGETRAR